MSSDENVVSTFVGTTCRKYWYMWLSVHIIHSRSTLSTSPINTAFRISYSWKAWRNQCRQTLLKRMYSIVNKAKPREKWPLKRYVCITSYYKGKVTLTGWDETSRLSGVILESLVHIQRMQARTLEVTQLHRTTARQCLCSPSPTSNNQHHIINQLRKEWTR